MNDALIKNGTTDKNIVNFKRLKPGQYGRFR